MSFTRFLQLGIEDRIPDGTTLWLFRKALGKAGLIEKLFKRFSRHLEAKGYVARGGQIVDPTCSSERLLSSSFANKGLRNGRAAITFIPSVLFFSKSYGCENFPSACQS